MSTPPVLQPPSCSLATSNVPNTTVLASGWNVITRIVDYILKNQSIVKMVKKPVAAFGGPSIGLLNRVSPLFTAISVAILAAVAIAYTKVKTTYKVKTTFSAKEFKTLLQQKYQFPSNCTVRGDLDFINCIWITTLPQGLTVQGNLSLFDCMGLTSLPQGLTVQGNLSLFGCMGLTSLSQGLTVQGNLILFGCIGLTSLPQGLTVQGNLSLTYCTGLTSLSQGLTVQGDLNFSDCTGLTSLPTWITTLGPLANGRTRQIFLTNTGLSEALLNRLRETPAPGIQFYFSHAASEPAHIFSNLDTALTFWVKATNDATLVNPPITIDSTEALANVLRFLSRLTETAEYKNPQARPVLAQRIIEAFNLMAEDEAIKGRAFDIIRQGLISCDDRITFALEEIELMALLHRIENTPHSEAQLRALGKRFLLLEMVNAKAEAHKSTLTWVDEIEVYLAFQIGLAERLNLPVKTRNMIFRGCAQVTDAQIQQAGDAVVREWTEEKLNDFLKNWGPWIAHQRKKGSVPAYEDLPVINRKLESGEICPFTQDIPEKPVLCGKAVYEYDALIRCYRIDGRNPVDRSEIDLKTLKRVVPPKG
ncbi:MAG TPA: NEL-type E3 ubiquitin ligase domain-containing protein [Rhabdochlamydiaceae bacterium]|nr:NEL-type E3 ubiquitin ligase domain-containing protein [Rhabdochlamydiaceae bacterium]